MYIKRDISQILTNSQSEALLLIGPRQCGKSTLLTMSYPNFKRITFDDLFLRESAQSDPELFLQTHDGNLILDEVQYVPNLFFELKKIIDEERIQKLKNIEVKTRSFLLSGSNQILLNKNIKESLAGRISLYYLNSLSLNELTQTYENINLFEFMFNGGLPDIWANKKDPVEYLNNYINTFIEKDVLQTAGIQKLNDFIQVIKLFANRTGEFLNLTSIANESGISVNTIKDWLSILERMGIVYLLTPYHSNLNSRLTKMPKVYFIDTGIAVRLQGYSSLESFKANPNLGHIFETAVVSEIIKWKNNFKKNIEIFVWRSKDKEEVDLILKTVNKVLAIEVKMNMQAINPIKIPEGLKKEFKDLNEIILVHAGNHTTKISQECKAVGFYNLIEYLNSEF
jgi:predicted AAA+ superfamily ATPase